MTILRLMPTDPPPKDPQHRPSEAPEADPASSASKDLADGLNLMINAARKALKNVDPTKIEEVGRRALKNLETIDAKKVGKFGYKAAKNLDPRKIEQVAEEAGKELLSVMERVAERVEKIASAAIPTPRDSARPAQQGTPGPQTKPEPPEPPAEAAKSDAPAASDTLRSDGAPPPDAPKRVRIGD